MAQLININSTEFRRCNLSAIQSGGTWASIVPDENEIILISTTNALTADGSGNCDAYIIGDGATTASALELCNIIELDAIPTKGSDKPVSSNGVYEEIDGYLKTRQNSDYTELLIDAENKILETRDETGKKSFLCGVEFDGHSEFNGDVKFNGDVEGISSTEETTTSVDLVDVLLDKDGKVAESTSYKGVKRIYGKLEANFHTFDNIPIMPSILYGKKWVVLGDSFTNGQVELGTIPDGKYQGQFNVYPYLIGNRTGVEIVKFFGGGQTLAYPADGTFTNSVCCPTAAYFYENIPADADYITIYLGINDIGHATGSGGDGEDYTGVIPLGTATDTTTATYYGAWNVILTWLRQNRPFGHIGILVCNCGTSPLYREAQIAMAKKYGVPYLDLNGDDRTPAMLRSANTDIPSSVRDLITQKQSVDYDGTQTGTRNRHPNKQAHEFESVFIETFLQTL